MSVRIDLKSLLLGAALAAVTGLPAVRAHAGQPKSRPDPANTTVLRDLEYVPGGPIQKNKDKVQRANPITYVTKDDPPFLIVHGDMDPLVPHNQSEILHDALKKAGVDTTLYIVPGGGHGGFKDPQVNVLVAQFFDKHLRGR